MLGLAARAQNIEGTFEFPAGYPDRAGAVVWIEKEGSPPPRPAQASITQKEMRFLPHVSVVPLGSTLIFKNEDASIHGVKSESGPLKKIRVVMSPKRKTLRFTVSESGVSELLCDIHAQMNAFIVVVKSNVFAISDNEGRFRLDKLPAPPFTAKIWHEILPPREIRVEKDTDLGALKKIKMKSWND